MRPNHRSVSKPIILWVGLVALTSALPGQSQVSGRVTWNGKPVSKAVVRWPEARLEALTDSEGRYSLGTSPIRPLAASLTRRLQTPGRVAVDGRLRPHFWTPSFAVALGGEADPMLLKPAVAAPIRLEVRARGYRDTVLEIPEGRAVADAALAKDLRRHLWIWGPSVATSAVERDKLFDFAARKGIGTLYLDAGSLVRNDKPAVIQFLNLAKARGFTVELLFGEAAWYQPANHATPVALAEAVMAIYRTLKDQGGAYPTSIQFDVEPYSLPIWQTDEAAVSGGLLDMYAKVAMVLKDSPIGLTACIPRWFDSRTLARGGKTRLLSDWLADASDRLTLMDYVDHANGIIAGAEHEIAYADSVGKEVVVGVETMPDLEPESVSFFEEGEAAMEAALAETSARFGAKPSWFGIAVHHYGTYPTLKP